MRNKFKGVCYRCGKEVLPGEGHFQRSSKGKWKWVVQHAACAIKYRGRLLCHEPQTPPTNPPPRS